MNYLLKEYRDGVEFYKKLRNKIFTVGEVRKHLKKVSKEYNKKEINEVIKAFELDENVDSMAACAGIRYLFDMYDIEE